MPQRLARDRVRGVQPDGFAQMPLRAGEVAAFAERDAEAAVGVRVHRVEPHGFSELPFGGGGVLLLLMHDAEVEVGVVVRRVEADGGAEMRGPGREITEVQLRDAEPAVGMGVVGVEAQSVFLVGDDLAQGLRGVGFTERLQAARVLRQQLQPQLLVLDHNLLLSKLLVLV